MSGRDYLRIWYLTQLVATLFFVLLISIWETYVGIRQGYLMIVFGVVMAVGLVIEALPHRIAGLAIANSWLQAIFQPLTLIMVWGIVTREIIVRLHLPARGVVALAIIYYLVMFAPFASVVGAEIKGALARSVGGFYWWLLIVTSVPLFFPLKFAGPRAFQLALQTGAVGAIAFLITAVTLMRSWHLSWPGIWPKFGHNWNWWMFALLVVCYLADLFWNTIAAGGHLTGWHPTREYFLAALAAGVGEEAFFRFLLLGTLLAGFRHFRGQLPLAIGGSALAFGLSHLTNLVSQPASTTLLQVVVAMVIGFYYAVVYLYTGQLWLTMLMHFLLDWLAFVASQALGMTGPVTGADWIWLLVPVVLLGLPALWILVGPQRPVLERHAARLIGEDQHFGYRLDFRF